MPCWQVALAYFDVQQARGTLAGIEDAVDKAKLLVDKTTSLARGLVPGIEVDRARAELFDLEQQVAAAPRQLADCQCPADARPALEPRRGGRSAWSRRTFR